MPILKAINLVKIYNGRKVVDGVNLEIKSGEIVGFLGRNGAGKTTTFQIIVGLIKPEEGDIYLGGKRITFAPSYIRAREGLVYLPQENSVFLKATVEENLKMIADLNKSSKEVKNKKVKNVMEELGISHLAKSKAYALSGGEKRRLEIARALLTNPKFLFLDEPFSGIDPITINELQELLLNLKRKGIGIIVSDHNVRDTFEIVDRAYIIHEGKILVEGPPLELAVNKLARDKFLGENFEFGKEKTIP
ncbi:LPS export ABC transporter ATP-binding protein [SCandidatus Aminicenantes bacterium Aminicenantia_JdfR_composite]|jgi:lipopolysaccharide export system ATP-binding protein|nr:LPS export ABC transporter ATP-binding protein [SCandidatus Aminicenantes bacterium Aminicenantia_JdfR_composite]